MDHEAFYKIIVSGDSNPRVICQACEDEKCGIYELENSLGIKYCYDCAWYFTISDGKTIFNKAEMLSNFNKKRGSLNSKYSNMLDIIESKLAEIASGIQDSISGKKNKKMSDEEIQEMIAEIKNLSNSIDSIS